MKITEKKQAQKVSPIEAQEAFEEGKTVMNSLGEIYKLCLDSGSIYLSFEDSSEKISLISEKPNFNLYPKGWVVIEN